MIDLLVVAKKNESVFREIRAAERLIARQETRKDGGWKCETEGEEKVMEVKREKMENRQKNIWHFIFR